MEPKLREEEVVEVGTAPESGTRATLCSAQALIDG